MNLKAQRAAALKAAQDVVALAKAETRELTSDEIATVEAKSAEIRDLDAQIAQAVKSAALVDSIGGLSAEEHQEVEAEAKSLADHFVKSGMAAKVALAKQAGGKFSISGPEFKAATDPTLTTGITIPGAFGQVVQTRYRRLTIADLLASGTLTGNSITYWTQGTVTGDFTSVAEGALKPSLNFAFSQVVESLTKVAGITKVSDEMAEDADFLVSVIKSQLLLRLGVVEEDQLLNGNGTAPNLRGLLNRSGIQTYATAAGYTAKKGLDGIFHATNMVRTGAYAEPDGIVINPADYEVLRLGVDANTQYYGGGPFTGAYGSTGLETQPGLWGMPTVVTPAIAAGTVLIGAFNSSAQVFRKGGVRVEATNSNEDDFKYNRVAIRAEERIALAVYVPPALVKVTLTA